MKKAIFLLIALFASSTFAQTTAPADTSLKTQLDSFLSNTGTLTVRESVKKIQIPSEDGSLTIEAVRLYTPGQENKGVKGIAFNVTGLEKYASAVTKFLDYSEIDDLVNALNYMTTQASKLDLSLKPEVKYRTKSDILVGIYLYEGKLDGIVRASTQTAYISFESVTTLKNALVTLKDNLK